jgi:hypothetical protein
VPHVLAGVAERKTAYSLEPAATQRSETDGARDWINDAGKSDSSAVARRQLLPTAINRSGRGETGR